ncbi:MAG: acetylhydrolase [Gammaproteobacteria bacterium]|nr:acetylhydrolase [Gammaproteobacteria bacterium]
MKFIRNSRPQSDAPVRTSRWTTGAALIVSTPPSAQAKLGTTARIEPAGRCIRRVATALFLSLMLPASGGVQAAGAQAPDVLPPFAVGNTTLFIHDPGRGYDEAAGVEAGIRTLITEVWYPVKHESITPFRRATYGDYVFGNRSVHRLMMTRTTFFHLTPDTVAPGIVTARIDAAIEELFTRKRGSYTDAPVARSRSPFPVVVMSHGDAGSRYNMQTACEHLAAHGYLVIAPEHTGNSPFSMTGEDPALAEDDGDPAIKARMADVLESFNEYGTYGPLDNYGQSYTPLAEDRSGAGALVALDRALLQRLADLRAVLGELERMNRKGKFAGTLDLARIGLMGRSFGASTVLTALPLEHRFLAGVAVAPPSMPDPRPGLPAELLVPAGQESAILGAEGPYGPGEISRPTMLLMGAEDRLIIDLAAARAEAAGTGTPTAGNPFPTLRAAFDNSSAPVVWAMLRDANHASFGVSGDYWWPELKPREFPSYFQPDVVYRLTDPDLAHRIQREKILAFFDLFVGNRPGARDSLLANDFETEDFVLEHRGF